MIQQRLQELRQRVEAVNRDGREIRTVVVTKFRSPEEINTVIDCGIKDIAENKVQLLSEKLPLVKPATVHLIGHLQTNKAKEAVRISDMIQSVDSERLLIAIDKYASRMQKVQDILLQVNIAREETKFGVYKEFLPQLMSAAAQLGSVRVRGLMAIMPKDKKSIYYQNMHDLFENAKQTAPSPVKMEVLSMGMSGDFEDAVLNGANMIRVGTFIFT